MKKKKGLLIGGAAVLLAAVAAAVILLCTKCSSCADEGGEPDQPTQGPDVVEITERSSEAVPSFTPVITAEPTPEPTATPEPFSVTMRVNDGFVKACSTGTYGVASDGSVRFMGRSVSGQHFINGWSSVIDLELNDSTTAALRRDGSILLTGSLSGSFSKAKEWAGIVDIAMGEKHLIGLRTDGKVVVCGENAGAQDGVYEWKDVRKVVAAGDYSAGLTDAGVLTTLGAEYDSVLAEQGGIADISAAEDRLVLLTGEGKVKVAAIGKSAPAVTDMPWERIVKVFAAKGAVYAIDDTGRLFTDSPFVDKEVTDAYYVAASEKHAVVLRGSGRCVSFGENGSLQGNVGNWRLLPFVTDEGWLLGYGPGAYIGGKKVHTGLETVYTNPATGEKREVTCVVLGDVSGNGVIDSNDVNLIRGYITGKRELTGAGLRAANIVKDSAKPDSIDIVDLQKIRAHVDGNASIDQYAKTDKYTAAYASAKRKNTDTLGYIKIRNTNIDYPIMYGKNWFYNDHGLDKSPLTRGSIYFYWPEASGNIVITGHNSRQSGTMFHQLHKVQDNASTLKSYSDRLWAINTYGETAYWEVWAMYEEGAFKDESMSSQMYNTCWPGGFNGKSDSEKQAWIDYQQKRSKLGYTVNVSPKDKFITLVTCGDSHADAAKGARLYFFLRRVGND